MRVYRKEVERLKRSHALVRAGFPRFGVNKTLEVARLLYEISKRDHVTPAAILRATPSADFGEIKDRLLHRRFPRAFSHDKPSKAFLPKLSLDPAACLMRGRGTFNPQRIIVEESARDSGLEQRLRNAFPMPPARRSRTSGHTSPHRRNSGSPTITEGAIPCSSYARGMIFSNGAPAQKEQCRAATRFLISGSGASMSAATATCKSMPTRPGS